MTRAQWQIDQGAACGCRGSDDYCPCQNTDRTQAPDTQVGIANGDAAALVSLIQSEFIGVSPDDQGAVLEDHDWRLIVSALARLSVAGAPDRPRR